MTCSDVRQALPMALVPGGTDARTHLAVEEHVAACDACHAEKVELLRTLALVEMDRVQAPDLVAAIAARLDEHAPRSLAPAVRLALAAAILVALAAAWGWRGWRGTPQRAARPTPGREVSSRPRPGGSLLGAASQELRLDRGVGLSAGSLSLPEEDWDEAMLDERAVVASVATRLAMPPPPARRRVDDEERVFPIDVDGSD